jgi:phosphoglycerate dehydrogenase-like enzyme
MTLSDRDELIVAHQLDAEFEALAAPCLPERVKLCRLPREQAWEVPATAQVLIAIPPRRLGAAAPPAPVAGWPRGLRWVQTRSTGIDAYPSWMFDGPIVTCGRGLHAIPIAEFVLASLLAVDKLIPSIWVGDAEAWRRRQLQASLHGKTLGLLGFGSIGQAIAERALAFGMRVLAHRRSSAAAELDGVIIADRDQVLAEADHLVLAVPLTSATRHLLDRAAFERVKPGVHLVNIARGAVLDQQALLAALETGRVGFASLDVTDPEPLPTGHALYRHPRVHISPHVSAGGAPDTHGFVKLFLKNLERFLVGAALDGIVSAERGY